MDYFKLDAAKKAEAQCIIEKLRTKICYSDRYSDGQYEYRHVILPKEIAAYVPHNRLMTEAEWRELGVQQSKGWVHYMIHPPERHVLLFRR